MRVFALDDERVPELHDVDRGTVQTGEVEELRVAVRAVIVVHGPLGNPEAAVGDLLHHFQADDAAVLFEVHRVENRSAHHPEVTVDVTHRQAEQQLDRIVIDAPDDDAVQWIRPADLVAVHQIYGGVESPT